MQEMKAFIQQVLSDQAEDITKLQHDLEEARTWATSARWTAQHMKTEVKNLGHETQEVKAEIKEVLEVHRDRIDGVEAELRDRDDWAHSIQQMVDEINMDQVWADLTDKEFRITTLEEQLANWEVEAAPTRARGGRGRG